MLIQEVPIMSTPQSLIHNDDLELTSPVAVLDLVCNARAQVSVHKPLVRVQEVFNLLQFLLIPHPRQFNLVGIRIVRSCTSHIFNLRLYRVRHVVMMVLCAEK